MLLKLDFNAQFNIGLQKYYNYVKTKKKNLYKTMKKRMEGFKYIELIEIMSKR